MSSSAFRHSMSCACVEMESLWGHVCAQDSGACDSEPHTALETRAQMIPWDQLFSLNFRRVMLQAWLEVDTGSVVPTWDGFLASSSIGPRVFCVVLWPFFEKITVILCFSFSLTHYYSNFLLSTVWNQKNWQEKCSLAFHFFKCICFMCISVLLTCMSGHHVCAWCSQRLEEDIRSPRTRSIDSCDHPCGCRESHMGSLEQQPVFLITTPSLQPCI